MMVKLRRRATAAYGTQHHISPNAKRSTAADSYQIISRPIKRFPYLPYQDFRRKRFLEKGRPWVQDSVIAHGIVRVS
jgi:muramidase (phage lysozyme)